MTAARPVEPEGTDPFRAGDVVAGAYVIERLLGRGASGVVYVATPRAPSGGGSGSVALKIIHPELCHSRQVFGRYKREAAILKVLKGPHIVNFLDFFEHEGLLAIALEYVRGSSLEEALETPFGVDAAMDLAIQICHGLETAHAMGVVHRDLKPANVMLEDREEGTPFARILDFGLAKIVHDGHMVTGLTERDMIFGTPEYMAPEQARGDDVDARCDVYSCGVMLYEMVTGTVPIRGNTPFATMTAQLVEPVPPPRSRAPQRDIPPAVEAVILRALAKDPADRYRSAAELREALDAARERRVVSMTPRPSLDDLHGRDTELALRRSQIKAAAGLLEEAERLAESKRPRPDATAPPPPARSGPPGWTWPVASAIAIATCIAVGVLLALK